MIAAARAAGRVLAIAHCLRFSPEWSTLKNIIDSQKYGRVLAARFYRFSLTPTWSWDNWLLDARRSGGAIVDLHIHDVDFINYLFGLPRAVCSRGVVGAGSRAGIDCVSTQYLFKSKMQVIAEGHWMAAPGFGFTHGFHVVLDKATIEYDSKTNTPLTIHEGSGRSLCPKMLKGDGYVNELRYFLDCIARGQEPKVVTAQDGRNALAVALAEVRSVKTGGPVKIQ